MAAECRPEATNCPVDAEIDIAGRGAGGEATPRLHADADLHDFVVGATPGSVRVEKPQGNVFDVPRVRPQQRGHTPLNVWPSVSE